MNRKTSSALNRRYRYRDEPLNQPAGQAPRLALSCREAAEALGISERTLWQHVKDGRIPHVRFGSRRVFPLRVLEEWLLQEARTETFADCSPDQNDDGA